MRDNIHELGRKQLPKIKREILSCFFPHCFSSSILFWLNFQVHFLVLCKVLKDSWKAFKTFIYVNIFIL